MSGGVWRRILAGMDVEQTVAGLPRAVPVTAVVGLRRAYLVLCLLLLAQFVLGMVVNLFVPIPAHHPGAHLAAYFAGAAASIGWAVGHGGGWLAAHAALGLALVLFAIAGLVFAIRSRRRGPIVTAVLGFLAILGAAFNGASFLNYNEDFSSMIMAGCFAITLGCYTAGLYMCGTPPPVTPHGRKHVR